jgi:molybdopterin-guanine dinucleotide biosynthesis protein A
VIRRDRVPRCGPLGGVYTALKTAKAETVVFLACDMPFISPEFIGWVIKKADNGGKDAFVRSNKQAGFPFAVRRDALTAVEVQIKLRDLSLQALARVLGARVVAPPRRWVSQLQNINTRGDFLIAQMAI